MPLLKHVDFLAVFVVSLLLVILSLQRDSVTPVSQHHHVRLLCFNPIHLHALSCRIDLTTTHFLLTPHLNHPTPYFPQHPEQPGPHGSGGAHAELLRAGGRQPGLHRQPP